MAGGITINQGAETDLMGNASTGQALDNDTDDDAKHGGATIEQLDTLELIEMNLAGGTAFNPLVVDRGVGHGCSQVDRMGRISVDSKKDRWGE